MSLSRITDLEIRLYRLITKSHLSIGAGEGSVELSAVDNPIIRAFIYDGVDGDVYKTPYIPASSIHGVVRSWVEKAIKSKDTSAFMTEEFLSNVDEEAKKAAKRSLGLKEDSTDADLLKNWEPHRQVCNPLLQIDRCENEASQRDWKKELLREIGRSVPCKVCKIFGYMGQRGRVRFTHAYPARKDLKLDVITRVAIDRLTGAADEGKLFDIEAVPPGVEFYFFTILENMAENDEQMKKDFEPGIRAFQLQLATLGAHSTVGFGSVDISEVFAVKVDMGVFDVDIEKMDYDVIVKDNGYEPLKLDGRPIDLDERKYPKFFRLLTLRKDSALPDGFSGNIKILRPNP